MISKKIVSTKEEMGLKRCEKGKGGDLMTGGLFSRCKSTRGKGMKQEERNTGGSKFALLAEGKSLEHSMGADDKG